MDAIIQNVEPPLIKEKFTALSSYPKAYKLNCISSGKRHRQ